MRRVPLGTATEDEAHAFRSRHPAPEQSALLVVRDPESLRCTVDMDGTAFSSWAERVQAEAPRVWQHIAYLSRFRRPADLGSGSKPTAHPANNKSRFPQAESFGFSCCPHEHPAGLGDPPQAALGRPTTERKTI